MMLSETQRQGASALYQDVQIRLFKAFELIDGEAKFAAKAWERAPAGGGGIMGILRGQVVEKAGANFSAVTGDSFPAIDGQHAGKPFFASGLSTITHMQNPYAPIGHMNVRIMDVGDCFWIGGGADLTPFIEFEHDTQLFHDKLKNACKLISEDAYAKYSRWCDEYFYLPHRQTIRGVGGVFFDRVMLDFDQAMAFQAAIADAYLAAYMQILAQRKNMAYNSEEKEGQLYWRGRYAEFNLALDRGTKFGLLTGGNPEAIFVSLPPVVKW